MKLIIKRMLYNIVYYSGLWLFFKYYSREKIPILMYHGVTDTNIINWTQIPVSKFKSHMKMISEKFHPVSLDDAVKMINKESNQISNIIAVTFDDGFVNNYEVAYPIIKKYNIPITIFLTTSFIDGNNDYNGLIWTDYVYLLLLNSKKNKLSIELGEFDLSDKNKIYDIKNKIVEKLKRLPYQRKKSIIQEIESQTETVLTEEMIKPYKGMNWDNVRKMFADPLISFGSHTINHEILSNLDNETALREIIDSKNIIEKNINQSIDSFAYPNGKPEDFNAQNEHIVRDNYKYSLTTTEGVNTIQQDIYKLKRVPVSNDTNDMELLMMIVCKQIRK